MGVPEDSHLRDPSQIPFPSPVIAVQDPPVAADEEENGDRVALCKAWLMASKAALWGRRSSGESDLRSPYSANANANGSDPSLGNVSDSFACVILERVINFGIIAYWIG